jgi:hypothetical protein
LQQVRFAAAVLQQVSFAAGMALTGLHMGDPEQKALELMAQAEKKMKSSGGFLGSLMG